MCSEHRPGVAGGGWDDPVEEESPLKNLSFTRPLLTEDKHSNDSLNSSSNTPVMVTDDISERYIFHEHSQNVGLSNAFVKLKDYGTKQDDGALERVPLKLSRIDFRRIYLRTRLIIHV